jgi:uncharacterized protein with NRDE domain
MCLIAFAIDAHPACPLLIAANRDEFFARPTVALHRWMLPGGAEIIAGRDARQGGTWLGVSPAGRVAMLTNVRQAQPVAAPRSRGELVTSWLEHTIHADEFAANLAPGDYGGFNLVLGDFHARAWHWLSNRSPSEPHNGRPSKLHMKTLGAGIWGLSNASLDSPWPKLQRLKQAMQESVASLGVGAEPDAHAWQTPLMRVLSERTPAAVGDLPATGVSHGLEAALSSPFVAVPEQAYGTRSSLLLRVQALTDEHVNSWRVELNEWTHEQGAPHVGFTEWPRRISQQLVWKRPFS